MPVRETIECWNCGHSFSLDERENCPNCEQYPSDEPEEKDFDDRDMDDNKIYSS